MYAVIETGGKQYRVSEGDEIFVEKLGVESGEVNFDKVVMVEREADTLIGTPYVPGAVVKASLIKNGKGKKINIFTYKPKKSSKRAMGHRQPYTKVKIDSIIA